MRVDMRKLLSFSEHTWTFFRFCLFFCFSCWNISVFNIDHHQIQTKFSTGFFEEFRKFARELSKVTVLLRVSPMSKCDSSGLRCNVSVVKLYLSGPSSETLRFLFFRNPEPCRFLKHLGKTQENFWKELFWYHIAPWTSVLCPQPTIDESLIINV